MRELLRSEADHIGIAHFGAVVEAQDGRTRGAMISPPDVAFDVPRRLDRLAIGCALNSLTFLKVASLAVPSFSRAETNARFFLAKPLTTQWHLSCTRSRQGSSRSARRWPLTGHCL